MANEVATQKAANGLSFAVPAHLQSAMASAGHGNIANRWRRACRRLTRVDIHIRSLAPFQPEGNRVGANSSPKKVLTTDGHG